MNFYYSVRSNETCGICLDSMSGADAVAHTEQKSRKLLHPVHRVCIREWFNRQPNEWFNRQPNSKCPYCNEQIDILSLKETLKEKVINELKLVVRDAVVGVAVGGIIVATIATVAGAAVAVSGPTLAAAGMVIGVSKVARIALDLAAIGAGGGVALGVFRTGPGATVVATVVAGSMAGVMGVAAAAAGNAGAVVAGMAVVIGVAAGAGVVAGAGIVGAGVGAGAVYGAGIAGVVGGAVGGVTVISAVAEAVAGAVMIGALERRANLVF